MLFGFICVAFVLALTSANQCQVGQTASPEPLCDGTVDNHEKAKYYKEEGGDPDSANRWTHLLEAVKKARRDFVPCNDTACNCFLDQVVSDLAPWQKGRITQEFLDLGKRLGITYQVVDHKLYRQRECNFPGRCEGIEYFLHRILPELDDTEFVVNVHDWAQVMNDPRHNHVQGTPVAVFSFSKDVTWYRDILYPAWAFWAGGPAIGPYPRGIGNWRHHLENIPKSATAWSEKKSLAFFRGSRTSQERDPLIRMSRAKPSLVDAQYTKNQAWRSKADTLGAEPAKEVTFEENCPYKYLLNLRGVAASFRFKYLFLCKSTVLHVDNDVPIEYFYPQLKPWIHYVPISRDLEDLEEKILFLRQNDELAKEIADAGFNFISTHLTMESVICYWKNVLSQYTRLLTFKPVRDSSFLQIISTN